MRIHAARHGLRGSRHRCCHRQRSRHPNERTTLEETPGTTSKCIAKTSRKQQLDIEQMGRLVLARRPRGVHKPYQPRVVTRLETAHGVPESDSCVTSWQSEPLTGSHSPRSSDPRATFVQRDWTCELSHQAAPTNGSDRHVTGPYYPSETQGAQPRTAPSHSPAVLTRPPTVRRPSSNERL